MSPMPIAWSTQHSNTAFGVIEIDSTALAARRLFAELL